MNKLTAAKLKATSDRVRSAYLVTDGRGREIGLLEKFADTRTEKHPWKAFVGVGYESKFLGAWYKADGGRAAALKFLAAVASGRAAAPAPPPAPSPLAHGIKVDGLFNVLCRDKTGVFTAGATGLTSAEPHDLKGAEAILTHMAGLGYRLTMQPPGLLLSGNAVDSAGDEGAFSETRGWSRG